MFKMTTSTFGEVYEIPLRLTPAERDAIALAAAVVTPDQRSAFANMVRGELSGLPPMCRGEGSLHRVIAECQKSFANIGQIAVGPSVAKQRGRGAYRAKANSSSASQRKPVTVVRADYEFAIAFRVAPPPPVSPVPFPPHRLNLRCGGRHFLHGRRVDRSGARTRGRSNRKPGRQAEKEQCVAHECLPGSPRRQRRRFPFGSTQLQ
jgi:hypothetical protein